MPQGQGYPAGSNLAGGQPAPASQGAPPPQVAPGATPTGGDQEAIMGAVEAAIKQAVDEQGFVDVARMIQIWPQIAQQMGINVPFETVLQMIQSNPAAIQGIIVSLGLNGLRLPDGRQIGGEELAQIGGGQNG